MREGGPSVSRPSRTQIPKRVAGPAADKKHFMSLTAACRVKTVAKQDSKGEYGVSSPPPKRHLQHPSALPQSPDVSGVHISCDPSAEYVIVVSMYEVHNDRIYDLLTAPI